MSTLLELSTIAKSNDLKDMMVVLFESENKKDLITAHNMNIIAENLATRVREREMIIHELDNCLGSTIAYESSKLNMMAKGFNPIVDLRPTLAEYKPEWWTSTNDYLQVYVPRTPIRNPDIFDAYLQKVFAGRKRNRLCKLISTPNTIVPRSNISSVKDCIIKELNSCIFKLEAIIQFNDDFCHVSVEFCNELNQAFLELFESSIIDSVGTPLDVDTQEEFVETKDYLVKEEFMRRLKVEERLLLEEERLNEEEIRVRLEEQKRLRLEEDRALKVKKKWEEDYKKRSYTLMNSDHMKHAIAWCAPKKRSHFVADRTDSWWKDLSRINSAIDNIWISDDIDIYLGKPVHLRFNGERYSIPWTEADKVFIPINEPGQHWCLAEFDIVSGVVTFYDSGDSYDLKCHDWYIRTRDCLQVRLPEVLELLNVFDTKGIAKSTYQITFSIAENVPKQGGVFGDCGVWAALAYRELMTSNNVTFIASFIPYNHKGLKTQYAVSRILYTPYLRLKWIMEEYIRLEEEKAHRRGKVYNWETATYGKIWYDEDVYDLRSVETEFPAIVFNDALTSEVALLYEPTVSPLNDNQIDFIISFDESDDEDYTTEIRRIFLDGYSVLVVRTVIFKYLRLSSRMRAF
ncbi:phospholipase-like protein [Tanacetum coccineum]